MTREHRPPATGDAAAPDPEATAVRTSGSSAARSEERLAGDMTFESEPDAAARSAKLAALIRAEIESSPDRRITFARYMERALYEPEIGYYRQPADRPTDRGDFLTAPETHAIFGRTIGRRIETMWRELGRPQPFGLIEYGAGSGTLGLSILDGMRRRGANDLLAATRYEPIESNPHRLADLRRRFAEAGLTDHLTAGSDQPTRPDRPDRPDRPAARVDDRRIEGSAASGRTAASSSPDPARQTASTGAVPVTGVILANEFLDALPVHRVVVRGGTLLELLVVLAEDAVENEVAPDRDRGDRRSGHPTFAQLAAFPSTPELAARLADDRVELAEGQVAEICLGLEPWLREASSRLRRGFVLAIDYGYEAPELYGPRRLAGTLLGYRGHEVQEDPLADPGLTDLTSHVDFTAAMRLAESAGFRTVSLTTQSELLVGAGLEEEWRALQSSPDLRLADYFRARSGIVRMLDPSYMGRFRALTLRRG
jgi:SAM-dependent MidA family methyltransferase